MCNALEELRQGEVLSNFTLSNVSFVFSFKPFRLKWNFVTVQRLAGHEKTDGVD